MNKKFIKAALILIPIICLLVHILYMKLQKYDLSNEIVQISDGSAFSLGDLTSFKWDKAYLDYENYAKAKPIIRKHNLHGYVSGNLANSQVRVIFVRNGWIVRTSILWIYEISFDSAIEVLRPNSVFVARRVPFNSPYHYYNGKETIHLTLRE